MPASKQLCSLSDVKAYLGKSDASDDALLTALIDRGSEAIESYCRREFAQLQRTEYHDGGGGVIVLDHRPVVEVAGVYEDAGREFGDSTLVPDGLYVVRGLAGYIERTDGAFVPGADTVKVVYTSGYAETPRDVEQACVMLVAAWYNRAKQGADGLSEEKLAGYLARYCADSPLPEQVAGLLEPYVEVAA